MAGPVQRGTRICAGLPDETANKPLEDESGDREYGAYLFPFYLDRVRGKPELVREVFSRMGQANQTR